MRGVYSKNLYEGGAQEIEFSKTFRRYAHLSAKWPRTFALLSSIANDWEQDAEREDLRARQDKLRS
jgi:hypothetical protein